jgi:hypothetical protein
MQQARAGVRCMLCIPPSTCTCTQPFDPLIEDLPFIQLIIEVDGCGGISRQTHTLNSAHVPCTQPCNPAVGGPAKSQLVHEVDALGGEMGKMADRCYLQKRILNRSKVNIDGTHMHTHTHTIHTYIHAYAHTRTRTQSTQTRPFIHWRR